MDKVSINLLPTEVSIEQQKRAKFGRVQALSIGVLLLLILLASLSVALRIVQKNNLDRLQKQSTTLENKVSSFKAQEATLVVLKNRVSAISQLVGGTNVPTDMFNLITDKLPQGASVSTITVDRQGNVGIALAVSNSDMLEQLLNSLTSTDVSKQISKIDIESLSGGKEGYRINLKITKA